MSSIDRTARLLGALALTGGLLLACATAQAATIVVRSTGPSAVMYPPGTKLPDNGVIVLKPGDSVTVLDAHGTRVLRGGASAASVPVAGTGAATVNGIAALIADNGRRQARTGATRGQNSVPRPTNVWQVDTTRGGAFCVVDAKSLALWRPLADSEATLTLTRTSDAKAVPIAFRAGQAVRDWPYDTLPVDAGTIVKVAAAGAAPVTIALKMLPVAPVTLDETAAALLAQGCAAQLDLLVEATTDAPE